MGQSGRYDNHGNDRTSASVLVQICDNYERCRRYEDGGGGGDGPEFVDNWD